MPTPTYQSNVGSFSAENATATGATSHNITVGFGRVGAHHTLLVAVEVTAQTFPSAGAAFVALSDSSSNLYIEDLRLNIGSPTVGGVACTTYLLVYRCTDTLALEPNDTITVAFQGSGVASTQCAVDEWNGFLFRPDAVATNTGASGSALTSSSTPTLSQAATLVIGVGAWQGTHTSGTTPTAGTGYTLRSNAASGVAGGEDGGVAMESQAVSGSTSAQSAAFSLSVSEAIWGCACLAYDYDPLPVVYAPRTKTYIRL